MGWFFLLYCLLKALHLRKARSPQNCNQKLIKFPLFIQRNICYNIKRILSERTMPYEKAEPYNLRGNAYIDDDGIRKCLHLLPAR